MKQLAVKQFLQKTFKVLGLAGYWLEVLGNLPVAFIAIIYGNSGNGKTEFCMQLAKILAAFDKVAWLSYEQGHGMDLQLAVERNKMDEVSGKFVIIDPLEGIDEAALSINPGKTIYEALDKYMSKPKSPRFIFIDSLDYTQITIDQYFALKRKHGKKKTLIFISHAEGKYPATKTGRKIEYDGGVGIFVKKFIAYTHKNRFGGSKDHIIYEKRARELNPLYFAKPDQAKQPKKRGRKPKEEKQ